VTHPDRQELLRIVAESMCDPRTVAKVYAAKPVMLRSWCRVCLAAVTLCLPVPPPQPPRARTRRRP